MTSSLCSTSCVGAGHEEARRLLSDGVRARSDGRSREAFFTSLPRGWYRDERKAVEDLGVPIAFLHGEGDRLVNLAYIKVLAIPRLWRGPVRSWKVDASPR